MGARRFPGPGPVGPQGPEGATKGTGNAGTLGDTGGDGDSEGAEALGRSEVTVGDTRGWHRGRGDTGTVTGGTWGTLGVHRGDRGRTDRGVWDL